MRFGNKIHSLRKKHNLSQEQLAERVGVARQTISKWELGETLPDIKQAQILSLIFNVSLDELFSDDTDESADNIPDSKKNNTTWIKIITISSIAICLALVIIGIFFIVNRSQILRPQGVKGTIVISRRDSIKIKNDSSDTLVFKESGKPAIACQLPEGFTSSADMSSLYKDKSGNFIKFDADYADNIINPLLGTKYYSYYEDYGYDSYMDMMRLAMYYDLPRHGVFSSKEELYLAGGSQLIRNQLCAGQNADYYEIGGELTSSGDEMMMCGFALHFDNTIWFITLKDYVDNYYFVTVKDPNGVGKSIDTIGEFLGTIYAGNALQYSNMKDTAAIQEAINAYKTYLAEQLASYGGVQGDYFVFQADDTRFVAISYGGGVEGIYSSAADALRTMVYNPDPYKLFETEVDNLWGYEVND